MLNGMLAALDRARDASGASSPTPRTSCARRSRACCGNVEYVARHGADAEVLAELRADAARLGRLVDDLLALERERAGPPERRPVAARRARARGGARRGRGSSSGASTRRGRARRRGRAAARARQPDRERGRPRARPAHAGRGLAAATRRARGDHGARRRQRARRRTDASTSSSASGAAPTRRGRAGSGLGPADRRLDRRPATAAGSPSRARRSRSSCRRGLRRLRLGQSERLDRLVAHLELLDLAGDRHRERVDEAPRSAAPCSGRSCRRQNSRSSSSVERRRPA